MILDAAEQLERLQAVDAELPEEIVVGRERARRHVEVLRGQVEDFLGRLLNGPHKRSIYHCGGWKENRTTTGCCPNLESGGA